MSQSTLDELVNRPYSFIVEANRDNGGWVIFYPDLPGCMTQADTYAEIAEMAEDALRTWLEANLEAGNPIPEPGDFSFAGWDWDKPEAKLRTTQEVAEMLGVTPRRVLAIAENRGVGRRFGRSVMFSEVDIEAMRPGPAGRPRHHMTRHTDAS
ncbi:MAG: type II toxin-antitoxin system HicB family antitoxin [Thermomicrobiales bacterium]|nr:type II toxin-antitoxin system HicB family antitoxin [Thermomicrobiales bacterium]